MSEARPGVQQHADGQQTQRNVRRDCQFCLYDVKYSKRNKSNKDPDTKYPDKQLHRS